MDKKFQTSMARKKVNDNRQQIVCDYIYDNYVQFSRLRHDVISNKVQIAVMGEGLRQRGMVRS